MSHDPARYFWTWWLRWMRRGFSQSEAGYMAGRMAAQDIDWLGKEHGYDAYCHYYAGGYPLPLKNYLAPRYKPENTYRAWRVGPPLPLP